MEITKTKKTVLAIGAIFAAIGLYLLMENFLPSLPTIGPETSLALIFLIGVLTSFHCIAMCGSFVVSYSSKAAAENGKKEPETKKKVPISSHLQYNFGKLLSYTIIGALFGLLGSIIVFTPQLRGIAAMIAGFFLLVFGLNLLNVFPQLRSVSIPVPKAITRFVISNQKRGPFAIGLLNGLMIACGPLQAMYIFAAASGSALQGAAIMFAFGLGTMPLLFLFGFFVSAIGSQLTQKIMRYSGALVIILGLLMLNTGFALAGINLPFPSIGQQQNSSIIAAAPNNSAPEVPKFQEIKMEVNAYGYSPSNFTIKQGIPVKWKINVTKLTGCNNEILVPVLGISKKLVAGEQTIEFTPDKLGTIQFSCWMGMIRGSFVVEANNLSASASAATTNSQQTTQYYPQAQSTPKGCGCGGGAKQSCGG